MGQRGTNHWAENRAPAERCEIPSPACMQENSQVGFFLVLVFFGFFLFIFCGSGADRNSLSLPAKSRNQLALAAPGMVPAAAPGGLGDALGIPHPAEQLLGQGREPEKLMDHGWAVQGEEQQDC